MRLYSDASSASNMDRILQLGYVIMLMDIHNKCHPLYWTSYKAKFETREVLGNEVMAFVDEFDMLYTINSDLQSMIRKANSLTMITDSLSLFAWLLNQQLQLSRD